jgi:hypothetical protein
LVPAYPLFFSSISCGINRPIRIIATEAEV